MKLIYKLLHKFYTFFSTPLRKEGAFVFAITLLLATPTAIMFTISGGDTKKLLISSLCQGFVYAWCAAWLPILTRRRWTSWLLLILAAIAAFLEGTFLIIGRKPFSPETLTLVLETDSREAASFAHQFVTAGKIAGVAALALISGFLVWFGAKTNLRKKFMPQSGKKLRIGLVCAAAAAFCFGTLRLTSLWSGFMVADLQQFENWTTRRSPYGSDFFRFQEITLGDAATNVPFTLWGLYLNTRELPTWESYQRKVIATPTERFTEADSVNIVIIIGESFIKGHSSLYGYPLPTNPRLQQEADSGRLAVFTDYISSANLTSSSLRNMLNLNSAGDGEPWYESAYFPLVAARGGWRVHLYDNQVTAPKYIVDVQLSALIRNRLLMEECYQWATDSLDRYDGDFISRVNREHPFDGSTGNLDIYHLYGQHFAPADRYPSGAGFDRWTADSLPYDRPWLTPQKRQTIAEYDNATFYNDSVIASIMRRYRDTPTIMLYFSDHGEEMYDASDCAVRNEPSGDIAGWLRRQFEIPMFIWASDSYKALRPAQWQSVREAVNRPGMLDNIGQTALSLAGATSSPFYNPRRDILSPAYTCPPRITVTRSLDYDSIRQN